MTSFTTRTAQHFIAIQAAKRIKREIEKAGLERLKTLAENGVSIVGTYLQGCTPKERADLRREFNTITAWGITPEMILDAVALQMPELAPIMRGKEAYRQAELNKISQFLKGS